MFRSLLIGLLVVLAGCEAEPSYDGRSMAVWQADLKSPDYMARWRALTVLTQLYAKQPEALRRVLPQITELLQDDETLVRKQAAMAVNALGPEAKPALPLVLKLIRDRDPEVREWAGRAAKAIDEEAAFNAGVR
jgi:HEAT repeat protein